MLTVRLCGSQDCMIGVVFSDESEAKTFYKKVTTKKTTSCTLFPVSSRERVLTMYSSQIEVQFYKEEELEAEQRRQDRQVDDIRPHCWLF